MVRELQASLLDLTQVHTHLLASLASLGPASRCASSVAGSIVRPHQHQQAQQHQPPIFPGPASSSRFGEPCAAHHVQAINNSNSVAPHGMLAAC